MKLCMHENQNCNGECVCVYTYIYIYIYIYIQSVYVCVCMCMLGHTIMEAGQSKICNADQQAENSGTVSMLQS